MRITKEKKQENRDRIVAIAAELFRERGFDGVSVADLMEKAGLTHGGFYNHFRSKEDLIAAASAKSFSETAQVYSGQDAAKAIKLYISRDHRDSRGRGCPAAALSCEAARQPDETKSAFATGIENLVLAFEGDMASGRAASKDGRAEALSLLAQAVGAVVLSRACPDDSALADEILEACRVACLNAVAKDQIN